jgi:hypothetical protein
LGVHGIGDPLGGFDKKEKQMSFVAPVCEVTAVKDHPKAERLSLVSIRDGNGGPLPDLVSAKLEDGSPRYRVGDWAVFLPVDSVLPEWLLRKMDFWDEVKGKGTLGGSRGTRLKMRRFADFESNGSLYGDVSDVDHCELDCLVAAEDVKVYARLGEDVKAALGIAEYVAQ